MIPKSIGIDTWAVDFVALDQEGRMIGDAVSYRDGRTSGIEKDVYQCIPEDEPVCTNRNSKTAVQYNLSAGGISEAESG